MRTLIITLLAGATLAAPLAAQDRPERGERDGRARSERAPHEQSPPQAQQPQQQQQQAAPAPARPAEAARPPMDARAVRGEGGGRYRGDPGANAPAGMPGGRPDYGARGDPRAQRDPATGQQRGYGYRDPRAEPNPGQGVQQRNDAYRGDPRAQGNPAPAFQQREYQREYQRGDGRGDRNPGVVPPRGLDARPGGVQQRDYGYRGNERQGFADQRGGGQWNRDWRADRRFDWQHRREADRGRFRAPRYAPPRGYDYGYRRWSVGLRLAPLFFDQGYWLGDADYYGLPPAYGPYRWIRYYDDVLLVDIRTGYVADVIYGFFW